MLRAIAEGCSTAEELAIKFPELTKAAAAVALSRAWGKGILLKHRAPSPVGRPHFVYRFSKNGHEQEIAELKARISELEEQLARK